jgi:hypothetical protein
VIARSERKRRAYTADHVRERLHQRLAEPADRMGDVEPLDPPPPTAGGDGAPDPGREENRGVPE